MEFVGVMINKMLLGMWKAYAIRPDNMLVKKKSSDSLVDILANKEVLQQRLVDAHFDHGVLILSDSLVLNISNFGFEFLKFSELKRMKMFLPKSLVLLYINNPIFRFIEESEISLQDEESDGFLSEASSVIGKPEQKKSFFQSSLHNRKIELTLSQNSKLKFQTDLEAMVRQFTPLSTILSELSSSIFQSLELTWVQLGYVGQHAGPSNELKSIYISLAHQRWEFIDLKDAQFSFKDVTIEIFNYKFTRLEVKRIALVPFQNICLKSGHLIIKAKQDKDEYSLNSTLCEAEINCNSLLFNLSRFSEYAFKLVNLLPPSSPKQSEPKPTPDLSAKINIISIKLGKDSKYTDFESLVVLHLNSFIFKKNTAYKLETSFRVDFLSQLNMSEGVLVEEGHGILQFSKELTVAVDKLKFNLDIERISVLKLLAACLYKLEGEESGIILTNSTQFEIQIKDQFQLGLRKFSNLETISAFQKTRWVSISEENVQNTLILKVFDFDEFELRNFHTTLKLLLYDSLVENQYTEIELHSFKTQQLITLIIKASFDFQRACFNFEFCEQYQIKNLLSNQYCLQLGSVKIESKGTFPFSAIRSLRKKEPKLLHERLTLKNMNLTKIHETELKSFNLDNMIARKERVFLSHNIIGRFIQPPKRGHQQVLEIKPRFTLENETCYEVDVCSLKKCKFQTCKPHGQSENNFCDFPFDVSDLDDKIQLLLKRETQEGKQEVFESKYQAQLAKLLSEEIVSKIGFKFVNRDKTKILWLRMERTVFSEDEVKLKLKHSFQILNSTSVPFNLSIQNEQKLRLESSRMAAVTDSFDFFDAKTKFALAIPPYQGDIQLASTSEFNLTKLQHALLYLKLKMDSPDDSSLFSIVRYTLEKPGMSDLNELIKFQIDPRIKGSFKLLLINKGVGLDFFSSTHDLSFLSSLPNFLVLSKSKAQSHDPFQLKQQAWTLDMINKFFANCENCFLLYFQGNEFKAISSAFEPGYQHRYALDFLEIESNQHIYNFQFLMQQCKGKGVNIEVSFPNMRLLPQNCNIKLDLQALKGKHIELQFDLDKQNSLREKFYAQVGQKYNFFWHLSSLQNGYLYFWVKDKTTKESSYVVADFNHQPFFVYEQHGFKIAYFSENAYEGVSFLPLQHSEAIENENNQIQEFNQPVSQFHAKISINEIQLNLSIIPKTLTDASVFVRLQVDKFGGISHKGYLDLDVELDAGRVTLSDLQLFEGGVQRSLSSITLTLPKIRTLMTKGGGLDQENYHKEWDVLVREVKIDIRDRLLLVLSYFTKYLPQAKESAAQYAPPSLIQRLKVSQIPMNIKVRLIKLHPQLTVNETQLMIEPLLIDKRKGELLMTFEELQLEAISRVRKAVRSQISKVLMNSNYLGEIGASLKDSKSSYEEGSYVKPIYFLGKGAGSAVIGFFSSMMSIGYQTSVSGQFISPDYYTAARSFYSIIKPPQPTDRKVTRAKEEGVDIKNWSVQKFNTHIFQQETLKIKVSALFPMTAHTIRILEAVQKGIIPQQKVYMLLTDTCLYLLEERSGGQEHDLKRLPSIVKISDLSSVSVKKLPGIESKVLILESLGEIKVIVQLRENLETMDLILDFLTV